MAIYIDPQTRQRVLYMKHSGDFTYDKIGDEVIATEDVPLIGNWEDWTGTGGVDTGVQMKFASQENSLQGQDPNITDKAKLPNLNEDGTRTQTHRKRVKKEYVGNTNCA